MKFTCARNIQDEPDMGKMKRSQSMPDISPTLHAVSGEPECSEWTREAAPPLLFGASAIKFATSASRPVRDQSEVMVS